MRFLRAAFYLVLLSAAMVARAQSVHWENGDSTLNNVVVLVFDDCEPDGDPQLPPIPSATLTFTGRSESMNMVNFSVSRSVMLSYVVQSRGSGPLQIPAFTIKTNKGPMTVAAFNAAAPVVSVASAKLIVEPPTVWAGQVFNLTYELSAALRNNPQIPPTFEWNAAPLVAEDWSKPQVKETARGGQRQAQVTFQTRAYAKAPGTIKLHPTTHLLQVQTGPVGFGLFSQARMEPVSVTSDQPTVEVKPLPTPPAGFSGAVGQFKFTSKVVPKEAGVGEPITWTLELAGTGNWPDIAGMPSREVSKDFQVVQPKAKRTPAEGKLFDANLSEDVVLIPTKPGKYTLEPVTFTYFDPQSGSYRSVTTERTVINVTPPPAPQFPSSQAAASQTPTGSSPETGKPVSLSAPAAPGAIPREPLPGDSDASLPLTGNDVTGTLLGLAVAVILFWLALAWRRATQTDPLRPQREAHARLTALLAEMRTQGAAAPVSNSAVLPSPDTAATTELSPLARRLLAWQQDAAIVWRIPHAAPNPAVFTDLAAPAPAASAGSGADRLEAAEWGTLWREADRALYGRQGSLPDDWIARAEAAVAARRVPGFRPSRLFLPQNLLPFAATIALIVLALPRPARAESGSPDSAPPSGAARAADPIAAYHAGDFAAAEATWRATLSQRPTDWRARHNLSLALAQQDEMGEAAAEATAAFVQHPNDTSVRATFAFTTDKAGYAPAALLPFLRDGPLYALASLTSPAGWQRILLIAACILAGGLAWVLWNAYRKRSRGLFIAAAAVCLVGLMAGLAAIASYSAYGETADERAVVVSRGGTLRSVPTEADATQKTTPLAAGSVAIVGKTFLHWKQLVFENGQTGWVRDEDVTPLWK
ncbi:MAG TPA: BatD family protein [Opitutaceae bacterium]|nr:BatD family protein [Opitutaceae bacterium]